MPEEIDIRDIFEDLVSYWGYENYEGEAEFPYELGGWFFVRKNGLS